MQPQTGQAITSAPRLVSSRADLGKEAVVADHHAELAEPRVEHGILVARLDARFDLAARQADLAILAGDLAVGPEQHGDVVDQVPLALDQAGHDVQVVLLRQRAEVLGRGAGDRLGAVGVREARADST